MDLQVNPLSFIRGSSLFFQKDGRLSRMRLDSTYAATLNRYYALPSLAPKPGPAVGDEIELLVKAGALIPVEAVPRFLRREKTVSWWPGSSAVYFLLAAGETGLAAWFEHDGHQALLFFGRDLRDGCPCQVSTFDGMSLGCETPSAHALARNKAATYAILKQDGHQVPAQVMVYPHHVGIHMSNAARRSLAMKVLQGAPEGFGFPVVVKPLDACSGYRVTFADSPDQMVEQLVDLRQEDGECHAVVEAVVYGREWRVLVLSDGTHAAYERVKFVVHGDGRSTIRDLIARENAARRRTAAHRRFIRRPSTLMTTNGEVELLRRGGLELTSVLQPGRSVELTERPHASLGGLCVDATDDVSESLLEKLHGIRARMGLTRAGFDLIGTSLNGTDVHILEVNSRPALWPHLEPDAGAVYPVAARLLMIAAAHGGSQRHTQELLRACAAARAEPPRRLGFWERYRVFRQRRDSQHLDA